MIVMSTPESDKLIQSGAVEERDSTTAERKGVPTGEGPTTKRWLVMDVFHQVHGPYTKADVKALLRRGNKFFVATPGFDRWVPVDFIPDFTYIPPLQAQPGASAASPLDARELERYLAELMGICRGVIADGVVVPEEAVYLRDWLAKHQALRDCWPADVISKRLEQVFEDGRVDEQEQEDLLVLLRMITSEEPPVNEATAKAVPLPLTMPEPQVQFLGKHFCLTGRFVHGPHSYCKQAITRRGERWMSGRVREPTTWLSEG